MWIMTSSGRAHPGSKEFSSWAVAAPEDGALREPCTTEAKPLISVQIGLAHLEQLLWGEEPGEPGMGPGAGGFELELAEAALLEDDAAGSVSGNEQRDELA